MPKQVLTEAFLAELCQSINDTAQQQPVMQSNACNNECTTCKDVLGHVCMESPTRKAV